MRFINIPVFVASLAFGIFLVYISNPKPDIIYVYPTPDNVDKLQYKDKSGMCFGFHAKEVNCPTGKGAVHQYPVQQTAKKK